MKAMDMKKQLRKDAIIVGTGADLEAFTVPRIKSNCFMLDLLTGGGIPEGRITIFHGAKSSGKTSMALRVAGEYLRRYPRYSVVYMDFEQDFKWDWAKHFISDPKRFHLVQPDYGEQGIDLMKEYAQCDDIGLIINDSLAMMIPIRDAEISADADTVGLQAKLVSKMFRKLIPLMLIARKRGQLLTLLLINQTRVRIGTKTFAPQTYKPGGNMQDFVASLDIRFYMKEYKKIGNIPAKSVHRFLIEKNRVGIPKRSGEYIMSLVAHNGDRKIFV